MSKLEELINKYCPNGVEYKTIDEISNLYTGLSGKSKNDFTDGNARYITYKNIYNNPATDLESDDYVQIKENENQNEIRKGDILVAGSSENIEDSGMVSVVTQDPLTPTYLNSFCFGVRLNDDYINKFEPDYLKHYFRSDLFRKEITRCSFGVTRYNLSKKMFLKIKIAVPPMEVQCEIVHILDDFTLLLAELSAELKARQEQYDYYRNLLLKNNKNTKQLSLKEIAKKWCSGGTPLKSNLAFYEDGNIPWLRTQEVIFNEIWETKSFITEEAVKKTSAKWVPENCVIVAISGATAGRCAINKIPLTTNQHCLNIEINKDIANYKYVFYCVCSRYNELLSKKEGARGDLNSSRILSLKIPIPSLEEQQEIVDVLDKFDKLTNDISDGLPAEIEARRIQYEYYRDKILNFKEIK